MTMSSKDRDQRYPSASRLNPNAPLFFPDAYYHVEDFSPEWWHLIQTSPSFKQLWLAQHEMNNAQPSSADSSFSPPDSSLNLPDEIDDFGELELQLQRTVLDGMPSDEESDNEIPHDSSKITDNDAITDRETSQNATPKQQEPMKQIEPVVRRPQQPNLNNQDHHEDELSKDPVVQGNEKPQASVAKSDP